MRAGQSAGQSKVSNERGRREGSCHCAAARGPHCSLPRLPCTAPWRRTGLNKARITPGSFWWRCAQPLIALWLPAHGQYSGRSDQTGPRREKEATGFAPRLHVAACGATRGRIPIAVTGQVRIGTRRRPRRSPRGKADPEGGMAAPGVAGQRVRQGRQGSTFQRDGRQAAVGRRRDANTAPQALRWKRHSYCTSSTQ